MTHLRQELAKLETEQSSVEGRGVDIERQLRGKEVRKEGGIQACSNCWWLQDLDEDDKLMAEWFDMVQDKTRLVRRESELVYELRDLELIEQHDQLEAEIRRRLLKDGALVHCGVCVFDCNVWSQCRVSQDRDGEA